MEVNLSTAVRHLCRILDRKLGSSHGGRFSECVEKMRVVGLTTG